LSHAEAGVGISKPTKATLPARARARRARAKTLRIWELREMEVSATAVARRGGRRHFQADEGDAAGEG
jgi:hypothetical protein